MVWGYQNKGIINILIFNFDNSYFKIKYLIIAFKALSPL